MIERKVGDPVWVFDINRRVYASDGRGGPIWREHWVKRQITAETTRSWIVGEGWAQIKIPKKGEQPHGIAWSEQEIERRAYVEENSHRIADKLRHIRDYETLSKVAELIGYLPTSTTKADK